MKARCTCLFSSLLARIFRLRGCRSAVFCEPSFVDEVDEADGLGALVGSVSVFNALHGLAVLVFEVFGQLSTAVAPDGVAGLVISTRVVVDDDVVLLLLLLLVDVVVVVVFVWVTGAGDGELLVCS